MHLKSYNFHWEKDFFYKIDFKRNYYFNLINELDNKFIINLFGLRRVGKTTLLKQFIDYLILEKQVKRKNIFFYSFDLFGEIEEKIEEYKNLFEIDFFKEKVYIFFDEIQKVPNWQSKIKIYYDMYPNIKFILTGSSSLYLQKKESLAGRMFEYKINPLYFDEFLRFKKLDYFLEDTIIYKEKILKEFEKYIFRQFFDIIDFSLEEAKKYIENLKNKIIKEDIVFYFKIEYPDILLKIFKIISLNTGMILDYKNFANDLDIDQRTLEKYIYYLQEAFLLKKVYNYSNNLIKSERKLKKVYLETTSFCIDTNINGEIFENYILNFLDLEYFYRLTDKEVDFIQIINKDSLKHKLIGLEIKYKSNIKKQDIKGLKHFDNKYKLDRKIVISKDCKGKIDDTEIIPFYDIIKSKY